MGIYERGYQDRQRISVPDVSKRVCHIELNVKKFFFFKGFFKCESRSFCLVRAKLYACFDSVYPENRIEFSDVFSFGLYKFLRTDYLILCRGIYSKRVVKAEEVIKRFSGLIFFIFTDKGVRKKIVRRIGFFVAYELFKPVCK